MDTRQDDLNKSIVLEEIAELEHSLSMLAAYIATADSTTLSDDDHVKHWIDETRRGYLDLNTLMTKIKPVTR